MGVLLLNRFIHIHLGYCNYHYRITVEINIVKLELLFSSIVYPLKK